MANLLGWPAIHMVTAWIVHRLPISRFSHDTVVYKARAWEKEGQFYRQRFAIQRWKSMLPDGAPWVGGFSKKSIIRRDRLYLNTFLFETRRAECAHWCMLLCAPVFYLWNPLWADGVMAAYAIGANLPCILVQRYNRLILARMLRAMDKRSA
jgi:glycosyl-4,4'-diaponeurosporenoate acyltransferase